MKYNSVIFDLDGTLIDTFDLHYRFWAMAIRKAGKELSKSQFIENYGKSHDDLVKDVIPNIDENEIKNISDYEKKLIIENKEQIKLFPEVKEVMKYLENNNIKCCIASSNPSIVSKKILEKTGIIDYFKVISGAEEVTRGKPHPDLVVLTLKKANIQASNSLMVGDTAHDILAGKAAGLETVLIFRSEEQKEALESKPDFIISNLKELVSLID